MSADKKTDQGLNPERRTFLKVAAAGTAAASLSSLAACSDDDLLDPSSPASSAPDSTPGVGTEEGPETSAGPPPEEPMRIVLDADPEDVTLDEVLFSLGVQSGAVRNDSVMLWAYSEDEAPKRVWVWRELEGELVQVVDEEVTPAEGYAKIRVSGLVGGVDYRFAFFEMDGDTPVLRSPVGRFRSADEPGVLRPITVAGSTCTGWRYSNPWRSLLRVAEEEPLDFFFHLGDISYNDNAADDPTGYLEDVYVTGASDGMDIADQHRWAFRSMWRACLGDEGYRTLLQRTSWYMTLDDHEITNDFNPERLGLPLEVGMQVYKETLPCDVTDGRIWHSYRWGNTLEVFILDCRTERKPSTIGTEYPEYISREQMAWLKQGLEESPCHFKMIMNSVPVTELNTRRWVNQGDRWDGFATERRGGATVQRDEILDHIEEKEIDNVWFVSGDFHCGFVTRITQGTEGFRAKVRDIAVGPGGNGPNPLAAGVAEGSPLFTEEDIFPRDQFDFWHERHQVATFLTFDPIEDTVRIRFIDASEENEGEVLLDQSFSFDIRKDTAMGNRKLRPLRKF